MRFLTTSLLTGLACLAGAEKCTDYCQREFGVPGEIIGTGPFCNEYCWYNDSKPYDHPRLHCEGRPATTDTKNDPQPCVDGASQFDDEGIGCWKWPRDQGLVTGRKICCCKTPLACAPPGYHCGDPMTLCCEGTTCQHLGTGNYQCVKDKLSTGGAVSSASSVASYIRGEAETS